MMIMRDRGLSWTSIEKKFNRTKSSLQRSVKRYKNGAKWQGRMTKRENGKDYPNKQN